MPSSGLGQGPCVLRDPVPLLLLQPPLMSPEVGAGSACQGRGRVCRNLCATAAGFRRVWPTLTDSGLPFAFPEKRRPCPAKLRRIITQVGSPAQRGLQGWRWEGSRCTSGGPVGILRCLQAAQLALADLSDQRVPHLFPAETLLSGLFQQLLAGVSPRCQWGLGTALPSHPLWGRQQLFPALLS